MVLGRATYFRLPRAFFNLLVLTFCLLTAAGCHNSCYSFTFNGTSGTGNVAVSNPPPTCSLSTANGIVRLEIGTPSGANSLPGSVRPHFTHLFVTVAGVDAHPNARADNDSPGWRPVAIELQEHPRQVDLLADSQETNSSSPFADAVLPAGVYGQVRLRFAEPRASENILSANVCSERALHCAMTSDGRVLPVTFAASGLGFRIPSENFDGQQFYIPPDGTVTLTIALDANRSFLRPSSDSFALVPQFRLSIRRQANRLRNEPESGE